MGMELYSDLLQPEERDAKAFWGGDNEDWIVARQDDDGPIYHQDDSIIIFMMRYLFCIFEKYWTAVSSMTTENVARVHAAFDTVYDTLSGEKEASVQYGCEVVGVGKWVWFITTTMCGLSFWAGFSWLVTGFPLLAATGLYGWTTMRYALLAERLWYSPTVKTGYVRQVCYWVFCVFAVVLGLKFVQEVARATKGYKGTKLEQNTKECFDPFVMTETMSIVTLLGGVFKTGKLKDLRNVMTLSAFVAASAAAYRKVRPHFVQRKTRIYTFAGITYRYSFDLSTVADTVFGFIVVLAYSVLVYNEFFQAKGQGVEKTVKAAGGKESTKSRELDTELELPVEEAKGKNKMKGGRSRGALKAGTSRGSGSRRYAAIYDGDEVEIHYRDQMDEHTWLKSEKDKMKRIRETLGTLGDDEVISVILIRDGKRFVYEGSPDDAYYMMMEQDNLDLSEIETRDYDEFDYGGDEYESLGKTPEEQARTARENLDRISKALLNKAPRKEVTKKPRALVKESLQGGSIVRNRSKFLVAQAGELEILSPIIKGWALIEDHVFEQNPNVRLTDPESHSEVAYRQEELKLVATHKGEKVYRAKPPNGVRSTKHNIATKQPEVGSKMQYLGMDKSGPIYSSGHLEPEFSHTASTESGFCGGLIATAEDDVVTLLGLHCWGGAKHRPNGYIPFSAFVDDWDK